MDLPPFLPSSSTPPPWEKVEPTAPAKKKWLRVTRLRVVIALVMIVVVLGMGAALWPGDSTEYVTAQVERGNLEQTVEVSGELEPLTEADLSFGVSGVLSHLFVEVGDEVTDGDVLAFLEADELQADLERANQVYASARAKLNQILSAATEEEVAEAKAGVSSASANLAAAQADLIWTVATGETTMREAEIALEDARDLVDHLDEENEEELRQAYEDFVDVLTSSVIEVRSALSDADGVLGIENTLANDDFDELLGANDLQSYTDAKNSYNDARELRDLTEEMLLSLGESSSNDEIADVANLVKDSLNASEITLLYTRRTLDGTRTSSSSFTDADLEAKKTVIDVARDALQVDASNFNTQDQHIRDLNIEHDNNEDEAYDDYLAAQQDLVTSQTAAQSNQSSAETLVAIREAEVVQVEATLARVVADPRAVDTASYEADVALAYAELDAAAARFEQTEITAPLSGIVTDLPFDEGEYITAAEIAIQLETSSEAFRVRALVPESDIAKLAIGDRARVTFDAYGSDVELSGTLVRINPVEQSVEGVVFYEVDAVLDDPASLPLKSGLSADVEITTSEREGVLFVPQRAVLEEDGVRFVRVRTEDGYEERTVAIGLRADGGLLEIIEGVEEGEVVITSIRE